MNRKLPRNWYFGSRLLKRTIVMIIALVLVLQITISTKNTKNTPNRVTILIISYTKNFERRAIQRDAWLRHLPSDYSYKYIVGDPMILTKTERIEFENELKRENDILIVNGYKENYQTIGHKVYAAIDWATQFETKYIVKTDDDILLRLDLLLKLFNTRPNDERDLYYGQIFTGMVPARTTLSKYYVSKEEYQGDVFPPYACGAFYVMTLDVAKRIAAKSKQNGFQLFKLEDVHMGILMNELGIVPQDNNGTFECSIHYVPHNETLFVHDFRS